MVAGGGVPVAGDTYSDILFYHDFETSTTCASCNAHYSAGDAAPTCSGTQVAIDSGLAAVGSNSLDCPTDYDRQVFTVSSSDIADHESGRIGCSLYITTVGLDSTVWRVYYGANDYIMLSIYDSNFPAKLRFRYMTSGGTGNDVTITTSDILSQNTWYFVEARWNPGGDGNDFVLYVDGEDVGNSNDAVGSFAGTPTELVIGEVLGVASDIHIDQFYSSSDPGRDLNALKTCTTCHP